MPELGYDADWYDKGPGSEHFKREVAKDMRRAREDRWKRDRAWNAKVNAVLEAAKASACRDYLPSDLRECPNCPCDEPNTPACKNLAKVMEELEAK